MRMKTPLTVIFILASAALVMQQGCATPSAVPTDINPVLTIAGCPPPTSPFPSYSEKYSPPDWWCRENKTDPRKYPIFQLSQGYPSGSYDQYLNTVCPKAECPWIDIDYKKEQEAYLKEVIKYAFDGNLENDWVVQANSKRKWYHAPYMHLDIVDPKTPEVIDDKVAREFVHGLTMERPGCVSELVYAIGNPKCVYPPKDPEKDFQSWAVSFYNDRGASFVGRVWDEIRNPTGGAGGWPSLPPRGFPEGTVAVKLLFTEAPVLKVPYLENSPEWEADTADFIRETKEKTKRIKEKEAEAKADICSTATDKCLHTLRLLQIDIAVRDRNSPVGWVFATFTYDGSATPFIDYTFPKDLTAEEVEKLSSWLRIKPLGIIFGNDPKALKGQVLHETKLNPNLGIPQHYGCGDPNNPMKRRLNGPVDNPVSSCISCHALSETPKSLNIGTVPYKKMECEDASIPSWFRNIDPRGHPGNATFTPSSASRPILSLDYSLQLREGIRRYCVESFPRPNVCNLSFESGQTYTTVTKRGLETFKVR